MTDFTCGTVIPVGPGREENLLKVLNCLIKQREQPRAVVLVLDGDDVKLPEVPASELNIGVVQLEHRHEPGMEQPRNVGVRVLAERFPDVTHVHFLDSDIVLLDDAYVAFRLTRTLTGFDTIIVAPYDWLAPGADIGGELDMPDPRWPSFNEYAPSYVSRGKLNDGLACFSGNLVWPIGEFKRIGGFWSELHHGRCEDGELGLQAVARDVPIAFCERARGWHIWHERDYEAMMRRNERDVPMLNARHPWVQGNDVFVVDKDGKRFDQRCAGCGQMVNTVDYWNHASNCPDASLSGPSVVQAPPELILPDGM